MRCIGDLHLHSHYARATAKAMNALDLYKWAQIKGIHLIGTGDFTHPLYYKELCSQLVEAGEGVYTLKKNIRKPYLQSLPNRSEPLILFTAEVSCIYSKGGKTRRVHILIWAPSLEVVGKINERLSKVGNLKSDGRPIIGIDVKNLSSIIWEVDERVIIVPAHAWTPWFSIFGSKSGFDSIEECFDELTPRITTIETGLSSDPIMNARVYDLKSIHLISNSDAHSPPNLGREATVYELHDISFSSLSSAVGSKKDPRNYIDSTIEFFPEEGRYHWDGHRACNVLLSPEESKKNMYICPVCHLPLTVGVESRVNELALRHEHHGEVKKFVSTVPLLQIIAQASGVGVKSKKVVGIYERMIAAFGPELDIVLHVPELDISHAGYSDVAEGIKRVRERNIRIVPGYDGEYGVVDVFGNSPLPKHKQVSLF